MNRRPHGAGRHRKLMLALHRWHRRIGVGACLFVLWMAVSGWLLNHDDWLHLSQREWHTAALLDWYGLKSENADSAWNTPHHWLAGSDEILLLDGRHISTSPLRLIGAAEIGEVLFVAGNNSANGSTVLMLSSDGALIDTLQQSALPTSVTRIGKGCNGAVIGNGDISFTSADGITWTPCASAVEWSTASAITPEQRDIAEPLLRPGVSIERLLLDLHSGRFFGHWGPLAVDAIGGALSLLALSGLWMFANQKRHRRAQRNRAPH